jgi:hypothetical protein
MSNSTVDIIDRGMICLMEKLGVIETEQFISVIMREKFDYTKWQREKFDNVNSDDFNQAAIAYAKEHPFNQKFGI